VSGDGWRARVDEIYGEMVDQLHGGALEAILDESLDPLGPDVLFDLAGELGAGPGTLVVDVGARDGTQVLELQRRSGCVGIGVEPAPGNLAHLAGDAERRPTMVRALGEAIALRSGTADLVWVRDVLVHVPDLAATFAEIARVAKPGAAVLVFAVFATDLLEPAEATAMFDALAIVPASAERANFERATSSAGLVIERHIRLDGQWREHGEEHDGGRTSCQLLRIARMRRDPQRYVDALGAQGYAIELWNCLYGVYQLLGKLSASIYVLRRPGP
jgi:SAM-dependent methyltransferase